MSAMSVTLGAGDRENCNFDLQYYQTECDRGEGGETNSEINRLLKIDWKVIIITIIIIIIMIKQSNNVFSSFFVKQSDFSNYTNLMKPSSKWGVGHLGIFPTLS